MEPLATIAMVDDLVVGLLLGAAVGFLAGPIVRSRIAHREWTEARREAELTDELLARLEDMDLDGLEGNENPHAADDDGAVGAPESSNRWRTSR